MVDFKSIGNEVVSRAKTGITEAIDDTDLGRTLRSTNLLPGAEPQGTAPFTAGWNPSDESIDWRVKLSLPRSGAWAQDSEILAPLQETDGMVFPYTPQVFIQHSADYDKVSPTHSNYPFPIYSNSQVNQFTITGDFTVENAEEGKYWIAATHFLRSITKMAYGNSSLQGTPPPVVKLNGYGDFVFNDVPVIVEQFTVNLGPDVDYIRVPIGPNGSYAPSRSEISISVLPTYSRDAVNRFSLDDFVNGTYVTTPGSIGYI
jgi:hypothetical protein